MRLSTLSLSMSGPREHVCMHLSHHLSHSSLPDTSFPHPSNLCLSYRIQQIEGGKEALMQEGASVDEMYDLFKVCSCARV